MLKLGLALGGGGARATAHIGALLELAKMGVKPDLITGSSAGGILGGLLAVGMLPEEMVVMAEELSLSKVYGLPSDGRSLSGNYKLAALLEEYIGRPTFADLEIPLAVVAVNLKTHQEVVLDEGDLINALLATAAFPVLFPPVMIDGQSLVDGGLANNVPFDVARARGAAGVIAISLDNSLPYGKFPEDDVHAIGLWEKMMARGKRQPLWQVVTAVSDIITQRSVLARQAISPPDIMLRPFIGDTGLFDFGAVNEGVAAGRKAVQDAADEIEALMARIRN
jgi:NTE family protein